jgi:UDP-N-acetylglucosamine--N-acetylmuramyl-(pentapeptide) pyrophosphoryl-undecaprenol N-acetylglucosamine transferase
MRLLIAGGGTGGHLFPAIAIAKAFLKSNKDNEVLFVGTKRGIEEKVLKKEGFDLKLVNVKPLVGGGVLKKLGSVMTLPISLMQSLAVLRRFKPDFALGVGGYASGPVILGAKMMGIKTGIQEQNIYPGVTNRVLGRVVDSIFLSFKEAKMFFEEGKVYITGNPVRETLFDVDVENAYEILKLDKDKFTILVFGGSLGAESINKAFVNSIEKLNGLKDKIQIVHQTGEKAYEMVKAEYERSGVKSYVAPFIYDMQDAYAVADVIVCRAGATSISEITALEKPAVLVPYPYAAGDHQTKNAKSLENERAAIMIKDDELDEKLVDLLLELYENRERLDELKENIGREKKHDSANEIVKTIINKIAGKAG